MSKKVVNKIKQKIKIMLLLSLAIISKLQFNLYVNYSVWHGLLLEQLHIFTNVDANKWAAGACAIVHV